LNNLIIGLPRAEVDGTSSFNDKYWLFFTNDNGGRIAVVENLRVTVLTIVVVPLRPIVVVNVALVTLKHDGLLSLCS
jgi:hypothetical protein